MVDSKRKSGRAVRRAKAGAVNRHVELVIRECQSARSIMGYDPAGQKRKVAVHRSAREVCKALARLLGHPKAHVHTNMGGPAIPGETYLHTGEVMLEIAPQVRMHGARGRGAVWVMFRRTRGPDDWTGGPNAYFLLELIRDLPGVVKVLAKAPGFDEPDALNVPSPASRFITEAPHA